MPENLQEMSAGDPVTYESRRKDYLLRVAAAFIGVNCLEDYTFHYDGAECDGGCLIEDIRAILDEQKS